MEQQPLFFEDIYDALKHVVQAAGGAKAVGAHVFPHKEQPDAAGRLLMDCLNEGRPEKLDPEHLLALLRIGHDAGCHQAIHYICTHSGYTTPEPIEPEDERAALQRQVVALGTELKHLLNRLDLKTVSRA